MSRWLIGGLPVAIFAFVAYFLFQGLGKDPSVLDTALLSKPVPAMELPDLHHPEAIVTDAVFRTGDVVLLNVFASWCVPCRVEHGQITRLAEQDALSVFGLNYKNDSDEAKAWLRELGDPYERILVDQEGRTAVNLGTYGVPETFIIDGDGIIRHRHAGPIMPQDLEAFRAIIAQIRTTS